MKEKIQSKQTVNVLRKNEYSTKGYKIIFSTNIGTFVSSIHTFSLAGNIIV